MSVADKHRHVDAQTGRVFLPGVKTANARRVVHLTPRGIEAYRSVPRNIRTPLVFHGAKGDRLNFRHWRTDVWQVALELAGLTYRPPYSMRHTFAVWSLQAHVPIDTLAREMGHADVSVAHKTYGAWREDMGEHAANLRTAWAIKHGWRNHGGTSRPVRPANHAGWSCRLPVWPHGASVD